MKKKHFLFTSLTIAAILSANVAQAEETSAPSSELENGLVVKENITEDIPQLASTLGEGNIFEHYDEGESFPIIGDEASGIISGSESVGVATRAVVEVAAGVSEVINRELHKETLRKDEGDPFVVSTEYSVEASVVESASIAARTVAETAISAINVIDQELREETIGKGKADFIFVIDTTGSMSSYINRVEENLSSFVGYLEESGIDYQVSVVSFGDSTVGESVKVSVPIHKSLPNAVEEIRQQLRTIYLNGGGDTPETPTVALEILAQNNEKEIEKAFLDGKNVPQDVKYTFSGWRDKYPYRDAATYSDEGREPVHKLAFLLTDADYKEGDKYTTTAKQDGEEKEVEVSVPRMADIINLLQGASIQTTVVSREELKERYHSLYSLTGGKFINIDISDYSEVLKETAKWVVDSIKFSDRDRDGLLDVWEEKGIDLNGDGNPDLPALSTLGAHPDKKDLFIEVDTMEDVKKRLTEKEYRYLFEQFKRHGIQLHIDAGPDSKNFVLNKTWSEINNAWTKMSGGGIIEAKRIDLGDNSTRDLTDWYNVVVENFDERRLPIFRHALIVGKQFEKKGITGRASNLPGSAFIVWADGHHNLDNVMGTFMHEFGHTLGLYHGGMSITIISPIIYLL